MRIFDLKHFAMPAVFVGVLIFAVFCGDFMSYELKSGFYTLSLIIKDCLIFSLPFLIFSLIYNSASKFGKGTLKFIILIVPLICCSNFINTMLSYLFGSLFINFGIIGNSIVKMNREIAELIPMFQLNLPKLISNDIALLSGFLFGFASSFLKNECSTKVSALFSRFQSYFFRILTPIMPLFILGTTLKLQHDGMLSSICSDYLPILLAFIVSAYGIVLLQLSLLSSFNFREFMRYIKNIAPAVIAGFGSMSSSAALPLSIKAAEDNSRDKDNAAIIIPTTVNIHLVGDCFFIPMTALAIMASLGIEAPSFSTYLLFAFYFVLAKFAVAAVPGGGILVMIPILQNYLNFNADMLGLITAIYILFDSFVTACNVAGNGAMAVIFDRIATKSLSTKS
ncbi:MAG: dicarboxylate/amino acid:cation symporter [Holosporaceae bacterium]|nr:dicarboxylate/amino acid:cation symporter [Holosporaceae bacterium]